jgi:hypothetical protein
MDHAQDEPSHTAAVDAWLARSIGDHGSSIEVAALFRNAFEALWGRAVTTLGTVTLTAITERVLHTATARHGFLSAVNPRPNGDARWKQHLIERLSTVPRDELIAGLRFALIELLTVVGRLTAEILSPELHAALAEVVASEPAPRTSTGGHPPARAADDKAQP